MCVGGSLRTALAVHPTSTCRLHACTLQPSILLIGILLTAYLKVSGVARSQKRCASGQAAAVFNSSQQESVARLWTFIL